MPKICHLHTITQLCRAVSSQLSHVSAINFARCFAVSWASTLYIHFRGLCPPMEFCQVQNSLYVEVLCSPIFTAWHSSSGRQPNFAAWYTEWNYGTHRQRHLYLAGQLSPWASAHILVPFIFPADLCIFWPRPTLFVSVQSSSCLSFGHFLVFGSRPSDHYFHSLCLPVCLFVCLCRVFFSRL